MSRDGTLYVEDIRRACDKVVRYSRGLHRDDFFADEKTVDAVLRNLEIIGEAVKHLPQEVRGQYPGIEWRKIAGFRDVAVHEYFRLDEDIVWDIVANKVAELADHLREPDSPGA